MVHGKTYYRCGCLRFVCPCCPKSEQRMDLNELCPDKHGGPPDPRAAQRYEIYDHVLDGGRTERRTRKVKP
jgi:hypothetical protein